MSGYILIPLALAIVLFGAPALFGLIRGALTRRRQAAARAAEAAQARQQELERLWREFPETAGAGEVLTYRAQAQVALQQRHEDSQRTSAQRDARARRLRQNVKNGDPVTAGYRLRILAGLALFLIVAGLGIWLDFLIFRGLHPTGTALFPFALACVAVIGISVGSVLFIDAARQHLLDAAATPYTRRVIALAGIMLASGIAVYMTVIAPYRSYRAGEAAILTAQRQLAADKSLITAGVPGADGSAQRAKLIEADRQQVAQARANLARAQQVDRWSAGVLAVLDMPLSEAAFLGAELLLLDMAVFRAGLARRRWQQAADARQQADAAFVDALYQVLVRHGHTNADELIPRIIARVSLANPATSLSGAGRPAGQDASSGPGGAPRPAPDETAGNGGRAANPPVVVLPPSGGPARAGAGGPAGTMGPGTGRPMTAHPTAGPAAGGLVTQRPPDGPAREQPFANGADVEPARLSDDEFDITE